MKVLILECKCQKVNKGSIKLLANPDGYLEVPERICIKCLGYVSSYIKDTDYESDNSR